MTAAGSVQGPNATSFTAIRLEVRRTVTNNAAMTISSGELRVVDATRLVYGVTVNAVCRLAIVPSPLVNSTT